MITILHKLVTMALMLLCCSTQIIRTDAFFFLSKLLLQQQPPTVDYNEGYGLAFSFSNSSTPNGTCAAELETIRQAVYPVYGTELVLETKWTLNDLFNIDPLLKSLLGIFDFRNWGRRLGQNENEHRRLLSCSIYSCAYVNSRPQIRVMVGCRSTCRARRDLTDNNEETANNNNIRRSTNHVEHNSRELETLQYGSRNNYLPQYGNITAASFYEAANATLVGHCRHVILNMRYVLIPITLN
jgi:hypothetical protein